MTTEPRVSLDPPTVSVLMLRSADEERACVTRTAALAWAVATAERYPTATTVKISVNTTPWRDEVSSGVRWVARVGISLPVEEYTELGPAPVDLEDLRTELGYIDNQRYEPEGSHGH